MAHQRISQILAAWREAERAATHARKASPEHRAAVAAVDRLRALYLDLVASEKPGGFARQPPVLPIEIDEEAG